MRVTSSNGNTTFVGDSHVFTRFYVRFGMEPPSVQRVGRDEEVLGLLPLATIAELRRAYRRLARANHPDLGPEEERDMRTRKMVELNVAYKAAMERRGH